jgi:NAD+ synthase (glutamine-hydrolysing)
VMWECECAKKGKDACEDESLTHIVSRRPIMHRSTLYNCRVLFLDGKIIHIRPKLWMANDGNYRELRYFTPWARRGEFDNFSLPRMVWELNGQVSVPFGDAVVATRDTVVGVELCEELFTPDR